MTRDFKGNKKAPWLPMALLLAAGYCEPGDRLIARKSANQNDGTTDPLNSVLMS
ncbi:hypothetical protein R52603_01822 [Paraburkholderia saeva]|nr:hypothetical protein R52603_01822 [Paraburkholderia saeva]CAG4923536.1 hypothetical protein R70241_05169 [Paraburkholderia saeva]